MQRIVLLYLLLISCTVCGQQKGNLINIEKNSLDTIYFPFYNGVQMIMVDHARLYDEMYSVYVERSMTMSQAQYFPTAPNGNEYFFRNLDGEIVKAYNTPFNLKLLSCYFQNTLKEVRNENYHVRNYADTNLYYPSKNMHIHNGYYIINNGGTKLTHWSQYETLIIEQPIKYGLIDTLGNVILDILYDQILSLPYGFLVQKEGKWGIINKKQEKVLAFEYDSHTTDYYYFDNYPMEKELTYLLKNGHYEVAYFMKQDSLIFLDDYYQVLEQKKGLFIIHENGKYGIIDLVNNEVLVPAKYEKPSYVSFRFHDPNREFYHLEYSYVIAIKNGKYGMINLKNKVVIPFKYDKIYNKHESREGYYKVELNGKIIEIEK